MSHALWIPLCLAFVSPTVSAQSSDARTLPERLEAWRELNGAGWRIDVDEGTGYAEFLYGSALPSEFRPSSDEQWFVAARQALAQTAELHGIEPQTLVEQRTVFLPLGMVGSTDKQTVRFRQVVNGVPVDGGAVNVLFDQSGRLLSVQTRALPNLAGFATVASLSPEAGVERALKAFSADFGVRGSVVSGPELVIAQLTLEEHREPRLAYKIDVQWHMDGVAPEGGLYFVDAHTGAILRRDASIHYFDVGGTVFTKATPGLAPDRPSNAPTNQVARYALVQSPAGNVTTDANGNFNFPGATGPLNCTFTFVGTFNDVTNQAGVPYSTVLPLTGTGNTVVLNPSPSEHVTAQSNAFVQNNAIRDWIRSVNPTDSTADFINVSNCNIASSCNAYYNGSSTNYFIDSGGCPNTCYSTVIAHETGHWLNDRYGTGNGFDGMGEGNADIFAEYLYDTNIVAQDFFGLGSPIRDGLNTRTFCGDCCGPCYGGLHNDGEVWMGAAWKLRRNLNNTLGNAAGDAVANNLFLDWMNAYNQTEIKSVIEAQWLTLDDNDGNISNGTPHYFDIDAGFVEQGFPGVPFVPIQFTALTQVADTTSVSGPYVVQASVSSVLSGGSIASVALNYRVGYSGAFTQLAMSPVGGNTWSVALPGVASGQKVFYYARATDTAANAQSFPPSGAGDPLFFCVGNVQSLVCDSFENAGQWDAGLGGSFAGRWERGDPLGTISGTTQAQPEFDFTPGTATKCYFTGQGTNPTNPEEADVDGGPYLLTSPPVAIAFGNAEVRYAYWFYNDDGDDQLLVQASSDGTNWTTVKTHSSSSSSWREARADVGSFMPVGATLYVRFSVKDAPNNSLTEAAIDDVCITTLAPNGCAQPLIHCASKIDSSFCVPRIGYSGYAKVSGNSPFPITLSTASPGRTGLLFYGYATYFGPWQGGALCAQPPLRRTPTQTTSFGAGCTGSLSFDFNAYIRSGADAGLFAGRTVAAQYYYRDPADPFGLGLSDGVYFTICP
ncbi:MAG: PepSY domain-containing protein [Planctomycetota bacterium]|nr:PepSY domain-containing protein [Planctomycetota bacterium]